MPDTPPQSSRQAEETDELKAQLAATFQHTADVLEDSARLAEHEARRKADQGRPEQEAVENEHAERARAAARRARLNVQRLSHPPPE